MSRLARRPGRLRADQGVALVLVVWGLGLISLMILSFMIEARLQARSAIDVALGAEAEELADAAFDIARSALVVGADASSAAAGRFRHDGAPVFCTLPRGGVAEIDVADEAGKVDLNAASPKLLRRLLAGLGANGEQARAIAASIVQFRSAPTDDLGSGRRAYAAAGRDFGPKRALFETPLELDQVLGITPRLFRRLLPLTTVSTRRAIVDPRWSPPALVAVLSGASSKTARALLNHPFPNHVDRSGADIEADEVGSAESPFFTIHAEVLTAAGARFVREGLVEARGASSGDAPKVKEWRRGRPHYSSALRRALGASPPAPC